MTAQEIVDLIVSYASIWAPAITAVIGICVLVAKGIADIRRNLKDIKEDTDFKDLKTNTAEIVKENRELVKVNKRLLDELTRVKGYAEAKDKEGRV